MIIDYSFKECKRSKPLHTEHDPWIISEAVYRPDDNVRYESTFSQANGYMGARGVPEEGYSGPPQNTLLGTFIAGVYDNIRDRFVEIVNVPNFFETQIRLGEERFDPLKMKIETYRRTLNMKNGLLSRELEAVQDDGKRTRIRFSRFFSMAERHLAGLRVEITPLNYAGPLAVETFINGDVANVKQSLWPPREDIEYNVHLEDHVTGQPGPNRACISVTTKTTGVRVCECCDVKVNSPGEPELVDGNKSIGYRYRRDGRQNEPVVLEKIVSVYTSRDTSADSVDKQTLETLETHAGKGFDALLDESEKAWAKYWAAQDIVIEGNARDQQAVRFNIFHLIQANKDDDPRVNIPAKCLTHLRYFGYFFWDTDTFLLPFFVYENPAAARNLLMFRYLTLDGARQNARDHWHEGAMYQMCALDGRKQYEHAWEYDDVEVHTSADIAYAVWQYYQATGDEEFLVDCGAEILCETSRYWADRLTYNEERDAYIMLHVKGPDEYCGITSNSVYTNMMLQHNLQIALDTLAIMKDRYPAKLAKLTKKIALKEEEKAQWKDIIENIQINYDPDKKLFIQDDNFMQKQPLDLGIFEERAQPLVRFMPYNLLQRVQVLRQADVLLLQFLLSDRFTREEKLAAWNFYEPKTSHDSGLSLNTHGIVAAELGLEEKAYSYFVRSARMDIDDELNTVSSGLHGANLGGTWQIVVMGYGGLRLLNNELHLNPTLPREWQSYSFHIRYRSSLIHVATDYKKCTLLLKEENKEPCRIFVYDKPLDLKCGEKVELAHGACREC